MRRSSVISFLRAAALCLCAFACVCRAEAQIAEKLDSYLSAIDGMTIETACAETDFIISSVQDEELRNQVATACYNHFRDSKFMGGENVAIYIYDNWFADFKALFPTVEQFEDAGLYAFVNRSSLIGAQAPELVLQDSRGEDVTLPGKGRKSVVFFYSHACPKCLYTALQLRDFIGRKGLYRKKRIRGLELNVYTVYAGDDEARWAEYRVRNLNFAKRCGINTYNLIGGDADYVSAYGVIQTPRLFLIDGNGVVIGRNLDVPALFLLLKQAL